MLVVKAKNICRNTTKIHKKMETELSYETYFKNSVPCHQNMHWLHHRSYMDGYN